MRRLAALLLILFFTVSAAFAINNPGSATGSPTYGTAKFSNGLTATSDSNYLTVPKYTMVVTTSNSWTVEAWLKTTSTTGTQVAVSYGSIWMGVSSGNFAVSIPGTSGSFNGSTLSSGISISSGTWHHVAMVVSGGTSVATYVDGVAGTSYTGVISANTSIGYLGRFGTATGFAWTGSIDEVAMWDRAKYTAGFTPPSAAYGGSENGLTGLFHLDGNANDSSNADALIGAVALSAGKFSNAAGSFSTTAFTYVSPNALTVTTSNSWTVEAWLKTTSTTGTQVAFEMGYSLTANVWMGVSSGNFAASVYGTGGFSSGATLSSGASISDGAWHHCAIVMTNGSSLAMYVDGVLKNTVTGTATAITEGGAIGNFFSGTWNFAWTGQIDEVATWSVAKYTSNFTPQTLAYTGGETSLQALYHLDSDAYSHVTFSITTASLPSGIVGSSYSQTITAAGGTPPYTFSLSSGTLPTGLSLSSSGAVSGTPTATGTSSFVVQATDAAANTATKSLSITISASGTAFQPNNAAILYSPYNWSVTSSTATTINSGAYLRVIFSGTSVALTFSETSNVSPYSELWARVDGDGWVEYTLNPSSTTWQIATGLQNRNHLLEVVVKSTSETITRWASSQTQVVITGIQADTGATLSAPIRRSKNILIYGDSITEGVRTVNNTATNDTDRNDVLADYSYALSTAVDAEVGIVAFGATGITVSGSGGVPALPTSYNLIYSGQSRTFSPAPDLVIYNEGTNDTSSITTGFQTVVNGIISAAPNAKQLLLVPFNGTHLSDIQSVVTAVNSANVTYANTSGWFNTSDSSDSLHPYGYAHLGYIAPKLFPIVERLLYQGTVGTFTAH